LAYLSEPAAQQLRAELLARAAGLEHGEPQAPVAPERVLLTVPLGRLVESQLRSAVTFWTLSAGVALVVMSVVTREPVTLGLALPFLLVVVPAAVNGVAGQFDFTVADSPDGLRLRRGLLETRAQTVPPGRIQAVRVVEPLLWRSRGWVRVEANVAGYVGESQQKASLLAPVATGEEAARLVALALPGLDLPAIAMSGVPARARFLDPWQWRWLSVGADERFLVVRRGRWRRETDLVPHEKVQSVRLSQAPLQRRLGLATLHVDTTPGPVQVTAAHRAQGGARELLDAEVTRAREARAAARPDRWMQPPSRPDGPTVAL
jgi:putative membrane protein